MPEIYVVLDLPSFYGYVSSPETAEGNAMICFLSSTGKENRELHVSELTIAAAKACPKCLLTKESVHLLLRDF